MADALTDLQAEYMKLGIEVKVNEQAAKRVNDFKKEWKLHILSLMAEFGEYWQSNNRYSVTQTHKPTIQDIEQFFKRSGKNLFPFTVV